MALVTLNEAKAYLRVDAGDEDATTGILLSSACNLCMDIARLTEDEWVALDSGEGWEEYFERAQYEHIRDLLKIGILYTVGYLFEHREDANHLELTLTLRALFSAIRERVV